MFPSQLGWAIWLCLVAAAGATASDVRLADAAQNDAIGAIRALLAQNVEVDGAQIDGTSPLTWAAHNDNKEAAELLLKAGANPRTASRYGIFPLSEAAMNGDAGGAMGQIKGGRHVQPPKGTPIANVLLRMLDIAGVSCDSIGDSTGKLEI